MSQKEYMQMSNKLMTGCSPSLVVGEIKIKITMQYQCTFIKMVQMKNTECTKHVEQWEH